jgi:hypothetical protein
MTRWSHVDTRAEGPVTAYEQVRYRKRPALAIHAAYDERRPLEKARRTGRFQRHKLVDTPRELRNTSNRTGAVDQPLSWLDVNASDGVLARHGYSAHSRGPVQIVRTCLLADGLIGNQHHGI